MIKVQNPAYLFHQKNEVDQALRKKGRARLNDEEVGVIQMERAISKGNSWGKPQESEDLNYIC